MHSAQEDCAALAGAWKGDIPKLKGVLGPRPGYPRPYSAIKYARLSLLSPPSLAWPVACRPYRQGALRGSLGGASAPGDGGGAARPPGDPSGRRASRPRWEVPRGGWVGGSPLTGVWNPLLGRYLLGSHDQCGSRPGHVCRLGHWTQRFGGRQEWRSRALTRLWYSAMATGYYVRTPPCGQGAERGGEGGTAPGLCGCLVAALGNGTRAALVSLRMAAVGSPGC